MPTAYPNAIDSPVSPTSADTLAGPSTAHSVHHDNVYDMAVAIETELGANPRGSYANVAARLNAVGQPQQWNYGGLELVNVRAGGSAVSGAVTIDLSLGNWFDWEVAGNITSVTLTNTPATVNGSTVTSSAVLLLRNTGASARTITWPGTWRWMPGFSLTPQVTSLPANSVTMLTVTTLTGGLEVLVSYLSGAGASGGSVPAGGTTGQALVKTSNTDYATGWSTIGSGGGGAAALSAGILCANPFFGTVNDAANPASTALKPALYPIEPGGRSSFTAKGIGTRIKTVSAGSTLGFAVYQLDYTGNNTFSATLVASLSSALSGASATNVYGAFASPVTLDFTAHRYYVGMMASNTTVGPSGTSIGATGGAAGSYGLISLSTARSSVTDWPGSFAQGAVVAEPNGFFAGLFDAYGEWLF